MSTKFQNKVLRKFVAVTFFFAKLFGLWIYETDGKNRKIKYNFIRTIYSICFSILLLFGHLVVGREFLYSVNQKLFFSFTFQAIFFLHVNIVFISFLSLYLNQYLQYEKRKFVYTKCAEVIDLLVFHQFEIGDVQKNLILFIIKAVVIDALILVVIWFNWRSIGAANPFSHLYLLVFNVLPLVVVRFYTNLFYGGILILAAVFRQFNKKLNDIVLHLEKMEKHKFSSVRKYCKLIDEFDKLSILHSKMIEATKAFNSVFSFQTILMVTSLLAVLVLRLFYQYVEIVKAITKTGSSGIERCILMCCVIFLASYDLYSTSDACESLVTQVRTKKLLKKLLYESTYPKNP